MDNARFRCCEQAICDSGTCDLATSYRPAWPAWMPFGAARLGARRPARHRAPSGPFAWAVRSRLDAAWLTRPGAVWRFGLGAALPLPERAAWLFRAGALWPFAWTFPCTRRLAPVWARSALPRRREL